MKLEIYPSKLKGEVEVPASKSLSHRAILAAALSDGKSVLKNVSYSVDVLATLNAVKALGVGLKFKKTEVVVLGGIKKICLNCRFRQIEICCHDSGSTLRFLIPIVAALGLNVKFVCSKRLISRLCRCGLFYCKVLDDCVVVDEKLNFGSFYFKNFLTSQGFTGPL